VVFEVPGEVLRGWWRLCHDLLDDVECCLHHEPQKLAFRRSV
jgi:hypothetical protein